jgi:hypothetical protein
MAKKKSKRDFDQEMASIPVVHVPKKARPHIAQEMREAEQSGLLEEVCCRLMPWAQSQALGVPPSNVDAHVKPPPSFQPFMRKQGGGTRVKMGLTDA